MRRNGATRSRRHEPLLEAHPCFERGPERTEPDRSEFRLCARARACRSHPLYRDRRSGRRDDDHGGGGRDRRGSRHHRTWDTVRRSARRRPDDRRGRTACPRSGDDVGGCFPRDGALVQPCPDRPLHLLQSRLSIRTRSFRKTRRGSRRRRYDRPRRSPRGSGTLAGGAAPRGAGLTAPRGADDAARIASASEGFVYLVSRLGVTGARREPDVAWIEREVVALRDQTEKPIAVGFGISTPAHVEAVASIADGVIVGSALIDAYAGTRGEVAA